LNWCVTQRKEYLERGYAGDKAMIALLADGWRGLESIPTTTRSMAIVDAFIPGSRITEQNHTYRQTVESVRDNF
jgi:hypothetical protein